MAESDSILRVGLRRALMSDNPGFVQLHFDVAVLDRYRTLDGFSIIRTDTVGRLRKPGAFILDFGISPDEDMIHVAWGDLRLLPEAEREHWAQYAVALPSSKMFLQMRLAPGSCFDDGELRTW